jgi:MSHA biogenesis protein MshL
MKFAISLPLVLILATACSLPKPTTSERHVSESPMAAAALTPPSLKPVRLPAMPPPPVPRAAQEVLSVVVNDVSVKTLLFALARDNKLNVDIHPSVNGKVTLNATDQTLPQLLERIASQTDIRYEITGNLLRVQPDSPYLGHYAVDYVNLQRQSSSQVSITSSLGGTAGAGGGNSDSSIKSTADNRFWDSLVSNLCQIVVASNQNRNQSAENLERQRTQERDDRLKVALELARAMNPNSVSSASVTNPAALPTGATAATPSAPAAAGSTGGSLVTGTADLMRQVMGTLNTVTNSVQGSDTANANSGSSSGSTSGGGTNNNRTGTGGTGAAGTTGTNTQAQPAAQPTAGSTCGSSTGASGAAAPAGAGGFSNPLMVNKESGVLGIFTTSKGHEQVRTFLDRVMSGARRQVLIEATVVEVQLSASAQSGVNWTQVVNSGRAQGLSIGVGPSGTGASTLGGNNTASMLSLGYANTASGVSSITSAIKLLESFGQTKVLSSPKLSVINNQTALIKVVDDYVYITIEYTAGTKSVTGGTVTQVTPDVYTSKVNTIPVGFVMTVTPQISDSSEVTLNVRPSITRVIREVTDPNPTLLGAATPIINKIPVIQSRELESILRVTSGEIAVLGGLMQESQVSGSDGLPGSSQSGVAGGVLGQRSEVRAKTELVVFMRPVVIRDASINGDYREYKSQLPSSTFFNGTAAEAWGVKR